MVERFIKKLIQKYEIDENTYRFLKKYIIDHYFLKIYTQKMTFYFFYNIYFLKFYTVPLSRKLKATFVYIYTSE